MEGRPFYFPAPHETPMPVLTTDEIQEAAGKPKIVEIPEWGGKVEIRKMTVRARDIYVHAVTTGRIDTEAATVQAEIAYACLLAPKFDSIEDLRDLDGGGVKRVYERALKYSGFRRSGDDDEDGAGEAEGNSPPPSEPISDDD